tara:strand:+ start:116 stop:349 length:234 start_codon:yes stop_codon:yes gene_type:complete
MTKKEQAINKLQNRISKMSDTMIISCLKDMAKPWDQRTEEERIVRAYLFEEYENRNGEDAVDMLFDLIEEIEESKRK